MTAGKDWLAWHQPYADEDTALSRRLRLVQRHITLLLDERRGEPLTVVSACASQGHDLLGVLATRPDAGRIRCTLLEYNEWNASAARSAVARAGLPHVKVVQADADDRRSYVGSVPADLVLMAGVFGDISDDDDEHRTIEALPQLYAAGAS